jgi:ribosomal protein S18 acetylase RimI-like enzyme
MRLDTLRSMTAARRLYDEMGFVEIAPYYENPMDDVVYLELSLG